MGKASNLLHFLHAIDRAHQLQKSFLFALTTSLDAQEASEPLTLEFEIMPPTLELTDKSKGRKKK
jgi:hypothetical protein